MRRPIYKNRAIGDMATKTRLKKKTTELLYEALVLGYK